jgi:hypothetical protein
VRQIHVYLNGIFQNLLPFLHIELVYVLPLMSDWYDIMWIVSRSSFIHPVLYTGISTAQITMDDVEVPFKDLLEHEYPEVYEYLKNAVRMLERQQNLLAMLKNIKNNSSIDFKVILNWCCISYTYLKLN